MHQRSQTAIIGGREQTEEDNLRYEFKKLTVDRVKTLFEKFNINDTPKPMALCDIYNYFEETGAEDNRKKLGF